ncbi:MAG: DUF4331 family protein [bacterium]
MKLKLPVVIVALGLAVVLLLNPGGLVASDHDDGETDNKARALNLTDLYAFREKDQNPNAGVPEGDLVFVMNTNPRSVARQQYYFSPNARYNFHVTRVANKNDAATGHKDLTLWFKFRAPRGNQQEINVILDDEEGRSVVTHTVSGGPILTTPVNGPADRPPIVNEIDIRGHKVRVYAGLREDPFFFDVEQYFRVRAGALGIGPAAGFRNPGLDFAAGYNVNAIVVSVPLALLQGTTKATVFDVWETISFKGKQVERLAQPAINEGLLFTNDFLNTLNAIGPDCEADALAGREPCASAAAPILAEAIRTLRAVGNSQAQALAIALAFLPDVMRIDTTQRSGYARAVNTSGRPITGRMLLDDVIDITLSVVAANLPPAFRTDNVSYNGPNLGDTRHKALLPAFPFLAPPN